MLLVWEVFFRNKRITLPQDSSYRLEKHCTCTVWDAFYTEDNLFNLTPVFTRVASFFSSFVLELNCHNISANFHDQKHTDKCTHWEAFSESVLYII